MKNIILARTLFPHIIFIVGLFILLQGCAVSPNEPADTNTPQQPESKEWSLHPEVKTTAKILLNSAVSQDELILVGAAITSRINTENKISFSVVNPLTLGINNRPGVSSKLMVLPAENNSAILIRLSKYFEIPGSELLLSLKSFNTNYNYLPQNGFASINNRNQVLVPVVTNELTYKEELLLLSFTEDVNPGQSPVLFSSKNIVLSDESDAYPAVKGIDAIGDYFFVSLDNSAYRIDADGNSKKIISERITHFFNYKNILYAFGISSNIYRSMDGGENWSMYLNGFFYYISKTFVFEDKLFIYQSDKIAHLDFENNKVSELINTGLAGNQVTSFVEFNGNVYATTLSGLFFKKSSEFFSVIENKMINGLNYYPLQ